MLPSFRSAGSRVLLARAYSATPQTVRHPGVGEADNSSYDKSFQGKVQVSKLDNGLTVASIDARGPLASVGLFIGAGTRQENSTTAGASQYLARLATLSTPNRTRVRLIHDIENTHDFGVHRGRESTTISAKVLRNEVAGAAELLLDVARPNVFEYEIREVSEAVKADTQKAFNDSFAAIDDALHAVAFRNVGLGRPLYSPHLDVSQESVVRYLHSNWKPQRSVLTAVNVDHQELLDIVTKAASFQNVVEGYEEEVINLPTKYSGGEDVRLTGGDTYIAVGFEGVGVKGGSVAAQQVLARLLQTKVVNAMLNNGTISNGYAKSSEYSDAGLLSVFLRANRQDGLAAIDGLVSNLRGVKFTDAEVNAAKAYVESSTAVKSERNLLGDIPSLAQSAAGSGVSGVTAADVQKLATQVLKSNISLVARGQVEAIPSPQEIKSSLQ